MKKIVSLLLAAMFCTAACMTAYAEEVPSASVVTERTDDNIQEPDDINPLTGEAGYNVDAIGKRPVAVMINNHPNSYPQYNINLADVVFEVPVEHGLTRFMALFADYTNVPYLVSVRSYRYYFPEISEGYDAFYIHWGGDMTMTWYMGELGVPEYDGLSNTYLFGRDQGRIDAGYDLEHTSAFYGNLLPEQIGCDGYRTDLDEKFLGNAFNFVPYGTVRVPSGNICTFADIWYGEQSTQLLYDEANGVYKKYANGSAQIDGISGEQMSFENALILYTSIADREDEADHKWVDVYGGLAVSYATGYYLSEGYMEEIRWAKDLAESGETDPEGRLRFYDMSGNEITINRGKTYITYAPIDSVSLSEVIPESYIY